ncbi:MAG: patatin-like phospholipase family protein [Anaerolineae bacterium]|nr:patatin-like phospholipase family protein [Anaerolineae bacterium]
MPITLNPEGKKAVLSIDAGGARGILPVMSLVKLEEATGQKCHDLFDFVAGTSVGAMIAGAVAVGDLAAGEMVELYDRFVSTILKIDYFALVFRHMFRFLFDKAKLRELLYHYFGDVTLGQLDRAILIPVKDMHRAETIFFVNRGPGAPICDDFPLAQVVEASISAPVFFEPYGDAVDGGVGTFGNVCYTATVEAMEYLRYDDLNWKDDNILHLSFGTGMSSKSLPRGAVRYWLPWQWPLWLLNEAMEEASDTSIRLTLRHYRDRMDFRRYQVSLSDDVVKSELGVEIPPGLSSNKLRLSSSKPEQVKLMKDIGAAFAKNLDFALTGEQLIQNPPPGYGGCPYPSRLPPLDTQRLKDMFAGEDTTGG